MTADPAISDGPADDHQALLLDEDDEADRRQLARLRAIPGVTVIDRTDRMDTELAGMRLAPGETVPTEARRWAWYSWRGVLVSVPGPFSFHRLRLDRNRNKITWAEQQRYRRLTIGVIGLSVGHSIAHTLALEGLCGRMRLADYDEIELSNLNRIPATLLDVGVNKAVVAARRISELDPYLSIDIFPAGLTEQNIAAFFDGLDLVVEECDSLDVKVRVREEAKARGIPVLMETSDRGLLDVERFDREPDRPVLHGLLGDTCSGMLRGLSTHDKAPHVMRILEPAALSARMAASMVEIDRTVSTWPQLAGDVVLGGATVAAAVRRFGRDGRLPSGRIRIDLDRALDQIRDEPPDAGNGGPAVEVDLTRSVPGCPREAVVHAIRLAPSGGNSQPWTVRADGDRIEVLLARSRTSAMDVRFRGSYVSIGAATFNAEVAAARHGLRARITEFPDGPDAGPVASIRLAPGPVEPGLADLYPAMIDRVSNRRIGHPGPLGAEVAAALEREAIAEGAVLHLIGDRRRVSELGDILAESDRIRYLTPVLHRQMMDEMRWPDSPSSGTGIDVTTLGLDNSDLAKLAVARRPDVMSHLVDWGGGSALGDTTRDRVNLSSAVAVLTVPGDSPGHYLRGGRALERLWIRACAEQLGVQPVSPVFLYARSDQDRADLSVGFTSELGELQDRFVRTVGLLEWEVPILVLRLSRDVPPTARSGRLDRAAVMSGPGELN